MAMAGQQRGTTTTGRQRIERIGGLILHASLWLALLLPAWAHLARGWVPWFDSASIAARSYQELTGPLVLVGPFSVASHGSTLVSSPGPLEFLLLSIPTVISPLAGPLLGAAALVALLGSLVIEAGRSAARLPGAVAAFAAVILTLCSAPVIGASPIWNPDLGAMALMAAMACAWRSTTGSVVWAPLTVATASLAAQCHSAFLIPAIFVGLVGLGTGLVRSRRRLALAVWALVVFAACWVLPLIDLIGGSRNLVAIASSGSTQSSLGVLFGLRGLTRIFWGLPLPLVSYQPAQWAFTTATSWVGGVIGILVMLGLTASHLKAHHRSLAGLGAVVLAASIGLAAALAIIPTNRFLVVAYVDLAFWPISAMAWLFIAGTAARSLVLGASGRHGERRLESSTRIVTIGGVGACVALAGVAAVDMARIEPTGPGTTAMARSAVSIAHAIEARVPKGRVNLNITGPAGSSTILGDTLTIAYVLHVDGWSPGLPTLAANPMGPDYRWLRGAPLATVVIGPAPEDAAITIAIP
ncbi:MAG: hypothetical protein WCI12_04225 [Actinomycetes bacterium]